MQSKFEIILEEDEEIDIDSIEELDEEKAYTNIELGINYAWTNSEFKIVKQQNQILKAVKQINKQMKEK